MLRLNSVSQLTQFSLDSLLKELMQRVPTLMAVLKAAVCSSRQAKDLRAVVVSAAVLLKQRNKHMGALHAVVACILHAGHASKRVCWYHVSQFFHNNTHCRSLPG